MASEQNEEVLRAQMEHGYEMIRSLATVAVQGIGFLVAADSVLLGFGISQKQSAFLAVACVMPALMGFVGYLAVVHGLPFAYVAMKAERSLAPEGDTLVTTYIRFVLPDELALIEKAIKAETHGEAMRILQKATSLRRLARPRFALNFMSVTAAVPILAMVSQVALFVFSLSSPAFKFW